MFGGEIEMSCAAAISRRRLPEISPIYTDLVADQVTDHLRTTSSDRRVIQALQARSDTLTRRIDIDASIKATVRSGAREPTFVMRRLRPTPEYLVLIQRENAQDQTALRLQALLKRLAKSVHFDIFFFQMAPDLLTPEGGGQAQPIETLAARFPNHRLLVLGDAADFVDQKTGFLRPGADFLATWEKRALLTPKPLRSWGRTEFQLARALAMPIGRATSEGLAVLGETLTSDHPSSAKLDPAGELVRSALPPGLQADQRRMIYPDPPSDYTPEQVIKDLQVNLHPATFDWLAALAVYPALQWDLTLYLGLSLKTRRGREAGQCLFTEARAGILTELPWLRHGYMPDWLRQALIEDMDEARREEIGKRIRDLLEAAKKDGVANDSKVNFRLAREPGKDQLPPEKIFEDSVFVDFLDKAGIVDLPAPDKGFFKVLSKVGWADRWSYVEFSVIAFAALYAIVFGLIAYFADSPPMTGSWRPLSIAGLGLLVLGMLGWPDLAKSMLERFRPYVLGFALAVAAVGILPLSSLAAAIHPILKLGLASLLSAGALYFAMHWLRRWSQLSGLTKGRFSTWFRFSLGTGTILFLSLWLETWLSESGRINFMPVSLPMLAVAAVLAIIAWPQERRLLPLGFSNWWIDHVTGRWPRTLTTARLALGILPAALGILQIFQMVGSRTIQEEQAALHRSLTAELDAGRSVRIEESPDIRPASLCR